MQPVPLYPEKTCSDSITVAADWCRENRNELREQLHSTGALLLRGWPVRTVEDFYTLMRSLMDDDEELMGYSGGANVREDVYRGIYTSTEAPPRVKILIHPEMSYLETFPAWLGFYCDHPSAEGGETPLADARKILADIPRDLIARLEAQKLIYRRRLHAMSKFRLLIKKLLGDASKPLNMSTWNYTYSTDEKCDVERACESLNQSFRWHDDNSLTTEALVPAIQTHPVSGERVWFNTIHSFIHEKYMVGAFWGFFVRILRKLSGELFDVYYGNGDAIDRRLKEKVKAVVDQHTCPFSWQRGDVLLLDNYLCWHGRNPYKGSRQLYAGFVRGHTT